MKKRNRIADILFLQMAVLVYSLSTVCANFASKHEFLSLGYIFFFGLEFVVLAIYAILWQQAIKRFQLSVAYAGRSMSLLWSMLWSFLIFSQGITPGKVCGALLVMAGVVVMNLGEKGDEDVVAVQVADATVRSDDVDDYASGVNHDAKNHESEVDADESDKEGGRV